MVKRHAPATQRNRDAIAAVLARELPASGTVLEVASGTGEHIAHFGPLFPQLHWQPSDGDAESLASIREWSRDSGAGNIAEPFHLDAAAQQWPVESAAAVLCINMVHISGWDATVGLFVGSGQILNEGAPLILYGPYLEDDVETAPSNLAFDRSLKERNPAWGLRNLAELDRLAAEFGFGRSARYAMPANNLTLVYRKA